MLFVLTCDEQMLDNVSRETYRARVWRCVARVARETIYIKDIEIYGFKPEQMFCEIFRYSIIPDICYHYHSYKDIHTERMLEMTANMVEKILTDYYSDDYFDEYDVAEVSRKVDEGKDIPLEDFIKSWAFAYGFDRNVGTSESVENKIDDFIENNKFDYLEMLENEEYRKFMDDIMYVLF